MKRLNVIWALALILALGMIFVSCEEEEPDTWTPITSWSQLNGTWKTSFSRTKPMTEWASLWQWTMGDWFEPVYGGTTMKYVYEDTWTINAPSFSGVEVYKRFFSSIKDDTQWGMIKLYHTDEKDMPTFDDKAHSISWTYPYNNGSFNNNWNMSGFYINQTGKKFRQFYNFYGEQTERIYVKQ